MIYMLDTNIARHLITGDIPRFLERLRAVPISELTVPVITEVELRYGVAKRGNPRGHATRVHEFFIRVECCLGRKTSRASLAICEPCASP